MPRGRSIRHMQPQPDGDRDKPKHKVRPGLHTYKRLEQYGKEKKEGEEKKTLDEKIAGKVQTQIDGNDYETALKILIRRLYGEKNIFAEAGSPENLQKAANRFYGFVQELIDSKKAEFNKYSPKDLRAKIKELTGLSYAKPRPVVEPETIEKVVAEPVVEPEPEPVKKYGPPKPRSRPEPKPKPKPRPAPPIEEAKPKYVEKPAPVVEQPKTEESSTAFDEKIAAVAEQDKATAKKVENFEQAVKAAAKKEPEIIPKLDPEALEKLKEDFEGFLRVNNFNFKDKEGYRWKGKSFPLKVSSDEEGVYLDVREFYLGGLGHKLSETHVGMGLDMLLDNARKGIEKEWKSLIDKREKNNRKKIKISFQQYIEKHRAITKKAYALEKDIETDRRKYKDSDTPSELYKAAVIEYFNNKFGETESFNVKTNSKWERPDDPWLRVAITPDNQKGVAEKAATLMGKLKEVREYLDHTRHNVDIYTKYNFRESMEMVKKVRELLSLDGK